MTSSTSQTFFLAVRFSDLTYFFVLLQALRAVRRARLQYQQPVELEVEPLKPFSKMLYDFGVTLPLRPSFWRPFWHLGVMFGALGRHFSCLKISWNRTWAPRVPQKAPPTKLCHPFGHILEVLVGICSHLLSKKMCF